MLMWQVLVKSTMQMNLKWKQQLGKCVLIESPKDKEVYICDYSFLQVNVDQKKATSTWKWKYMPESGLESGVRVLIWIFLPKGVHAPVQIQQQQQQQHSNRGWSCSLSAAVAVFAKNDDEGHAEAEATASPLWSSPFQMSLLWFAS
jgi:hypothetical protein